MATQKQIAFAASNNTRRPVSSIPGIGPANTQYLNNHGYYTVQDLLDDCGHMSRSEGIQFLLSVGVSRGDYAASCFDAIMSIKNSIPSLPINSNMSNYAEVPKNSDEKVFIEKINQLTLQLGDVAKQQKDLKDKLKVIEKQINFDENFHILSNKIDELKNAQTNIIRTIAGNEEQSKNSYQHLHSILVNLNEHQIKFKNTFTSEINQCKAKSDNIDSTLSKTLSDLKDLTQATKNYNEINESEKADLKKSIAIVDENFVAFTEEVRIRDDELSQWKLAHTSSLQQLKEMQTLNGSTSNNLNVEIDKINKTMKEIEDVNAGVNTCLKHHESVLNHHELVVKYIKEDEKDLIKEINKLKSRLNSIEKKNNISKFAVEDKREIQLNGVPEVSSSSINLSSSVDVDLIKGLIRDEIGEYGKEQLQFVNLVSDNWLILTMIFLLVALIIVYFL